MGPESVGSRWETLQARAHLPGVQTIIRREISRGTIRVIPAPGGGIHFIPAGITSPVEEPKPFAAVGLRLNDDHRRVPVLCIERITR
jgi:hypothetical protein